MTLRLHAAVTVYSLALASGGLATTASSAIGQDGRTFLRKSWQYLLERCTKAFNQPQQFGLVCCRSVKYR